MCLPWSSCSGCLVLDIKPRSCVITHHTLGLPARPQHAWQDSLAFLSVMRETQFYGAWSPHHSQDLGQLRGQLPPDHSAREPRCTMNAAACGLAQKDHGEPQSPHWKESPEVQVKFLCGRRHFLLRVENKCS